MIAELYSPAQTVHQVGNGVCGAGFPTCAPKQSLSQGLDVSKYDST
jgi:hypothetical protein